MFKLTFHKLTINGKIIYEGLSEYRLNKAYDRVCKSSQGLTHVKCSWKHIKFKDLFNWKNIKGVT